jgi:cytochrome oxidase Cu insertion factor (SCO1/SenC/PrrC family)
MSRGTIPITATSFAEIPNGCKENKLPHSARPGLSNPAGAVGGIISLRIPNNPVQGEPAPDFTVHRLGGETFTLSAQRGAPILLIPTMTGCSECLITLQELATVYPVYRNRDLKVITLSLFPNDTPDIWQEFAAITLNVGLLA